MTKATNNHIPAADLMDAIRAKRDGLLERDKALLAEQIAMERDGVQPEAPGTKSGARELATELLNGFAPPSMKSKDRPESERLFALLQERAAIRIATEALGSSEMQARAQALSEILESTGEQWRDIVRRRALAVIELRAANKTADAFRRQVISKTGLRPGLKCDPSMGVVFGPRTSGDPIDAFLRDCVKAGFITEKEISDAK